MRMPSKFIRPISVFLLAIFAVWLWHVLLSVSVVNAHATTPSSSSSLPLAAPLVDDADEVLGEACGAGQLLPPSAICLYGAVLQSNGQNGLIALDNVPITISYGDESITGTTFVHPGQLTPTFGMDISPLEPVFLEPVTLTAVVSGTVIERQVVVFPDIGTQSQRVDVQIAQAGASEPAAIWGHVVEFSEGGPVSDAIVFATHNGHSIETITKDHPSETLPIYTFSQQELASIQATAGSLITLTASYNGDQNQRVVTVPSAGMQTQVNFVTGWKCDGFNPKPLPSDGDVTGTGQTSGGYALPDVSCFWGDGRLDGVAIAGMDVQIESNSATHTAQTQRYPGQSLPRYGIRVWGVDNGQQITVTGVISGSMVRQLLTVSLDSNLSQRVDLDLSSQPPQADLSLQMNGPATVLAGEHFTYTLRIKNRGRIDADNPRLTLTLPVDAIYVHASPRPASTNGPMLIWQGGTIPTLNPNDSFTLVVTATVPTHFNADVTAKAHISTNSPESYLANNDASATTFVRDPRPDVRVNVMAPPVLLAGQKAVYHIRADNWGGKVATDTRLTLNLPPQLTYDDASLLPSTPTSSSTLSWQLGTLSASTPPAPRIIILTTTVGSTLPQGALALSGHISTTSEESDSSNNETNINVRTSLSDSLTLILVAPDRLAGHYGATPVLSEVYELAADAKVGGIVLDVERDPGVQAAYAAWDASPANSQANAVATAIKALIGQYTRDYPSLKYLVFVGSDEIIPFYRVSDLANTPPWQEVDYYQYVPSGTVRRALQGNHLLTDDFYAAQISTTMSNGHALYLPDLASGRLLETPKEISATINAFLANNGQIVLDQSVVGSLEPLTDDLGDAVCGWAALDRIAASCTYSETVFKNNVLSQTTGLSTSAFHSNHFSQGQLQSHDILNRSIDYTQTLMVSIGCHAGLNVPDPVSTAQFDLPPPQEHYVDLPQAILRRGGTYIGTTAYGYASDINIGYSEAVAENLSLQLLITETQTLGSALVEAKQKYFVDTSHFDPLDEKVLQPLTLYGLPMLEVSTPSSMLTGPVPSAFPPTLVQSGSLTVVTYNLNDLAYTAHDVEKGVYYDFDGKTIAKHGFPVQPSQQVPLTATLKNDQNPHGVILRHATYSEQHSFDPVIAEASSMSENSQPRAELPVTTQGWDHPLPYSLAQFEGLFERKANLNLVLGAYHSEEATERLYENMTLEVLYSNSSDRTAPTIHFANANNVANLTSLSVSASDDSQVNEVIGVCDDGEGHWSTVSLEPSENENENDLWAGTCQNTERFYVQVVDEAGNVAVSEWQSLSTSPTDPTSISLIAGWNLVSIPVQPENTNITVVLASIAGHYDLVYAYDSCDVEDPWKKYDPSAPPFANDLTDVDSSMGLWIRMTSEASTLEVSGSEAAESIIPLCTGWNLVGYPSLQARPIEEALASIAGIYDKVYAYDATDSDDLWKSFDPTVPPFANDLEQMAPQRGYWIKTSEDIEWLINN